MAAELLFRKGIFKKGFSKKKMVLQKEKLQVCDEHLLKNNPFKMVAKIRFEIVE